MNRNTTLLSNEKISKLLFRLSIPAIIGMLVTATYNIVDAIFVGQSEGPLAIGALAIVFPIQMLLYAPAMTIGVGGASILSRQLGAKQTNTANHTFRTILGLFCILMLLLLPLFYSFRKEILQVFGATGNIYQYTHEYFNILLIGAPFISFAMMANNVLRSEGNARIAMQSMLFSSIMNLILDPIFIFGFEMGLKGAAIATVISQVVAFLYVMYVFLSGRSLFRFSKKVLAFDVQTAKEIFAIGMSSFARNISSSVVGAVINQNLMKYGTEISIAVFGILNRVIMLSIMPLIGLVQGFLPIAGFSYGAKNFVRLKQAIKVSIGVSTLFITACFVSIQLGAEFIISVFTNNTSLQAEGVFALKRVAIAFPLIGFQVMGAGFFQAIGKALPSFFLSLSRQVIFLIPFIFIFPLFMGINGIWYSFPAADLSSFFVTAFFLWRAIQDVNKNLEAQQLQQG